MADHFDKIQKLPDPVPGCPNFRRVPGFKVYCCGQPTIAGFEAALEKVTANYPKDGPIIWSVSLATHLKELVCTYHSYFGFRKTCTLIYLTLQF